MSEQIGFEVYLGLPYEDAVEIVTTALKAEGFGVLTRIDVKAIVKERLNEEFRPYVILGACNPPLAHRALSTSEGIAGLMLPCNVTVEANPDGGSITRIANPEVMLQAGQLGENPVLREVAVEARTKLERVAEMLTKN